MFVRVVRAVARWTVSASTVLDVVKETAFARLVHAVGWWTVFALVARVVGWWIVLAHQFAAVAEIINLTANAHRKDRSFRKVFVFVAVRLLANVRRRLPIKVPDAPIVMAGNTFADV